MQTNFLDLSPEIRLCIFQQLFHQSSGQIHGIKRSRILQTYNSDQSRLPWADRDLETSELTDENVEKEIPKNAQVLHTCRILHREAASVLYGSNTVCLYAENNNDIFKWMLDIGELNRLLIRRLEIGWSHVVDERYKAGRTSDLLRWMTHMETQSVIQLEKELTTMTTSTSRLINDTFELLSPNQNLLSLNNYTPATQTKAWFIREMIRTPDQSPLMMDPNACLPNALGKMMGIKKLEIGYIRDAHLVEEIAHATRAEEVVVWFRPKGIRSWNMLKEERLRWSESGWQLEQDTARKRFDKHQLAEKKPAMTP